MTRWCHVTWSTYGVWLPGDPRGFRSRDGKVKSTGDYRFRGLPNKHEGLLEFSRESLARPPVEQRAARRREVLGLLLEEASNIGIPIEALSVSRAHVHALLMLEPRAERRAVGRLKRRVSLRCRDWSPGGLWGEACWIDVVQDKPHFDAVRGYILNHAEKEGASVWSAEE